MKHLRYEPFPPQGPGSAELPTETAASGPPRGALSRRELLRGAQALGVAALAPLGCGSGDESPGPEQLFQHGVASGDPLPDGVILWTRLSPASDKPLDVAWEIASEATFDAVVASGAVPTSDERDFTVKVDARGLQPGQSYFYRFRAREQTSPVGRTRTAPTGPTARARFGVASCSSYAQGYFHAYRALAARADLDAIIHLGDYIYESGPGQFGGARAIEPPREATTLADYRTRHAQYKRDPDLQEVHRQHPFICIWDDHETADNSWRDGALNHQPGEGSWAARKTAAEQAYAEWMPIRDQDDPGRIWRKLAWGDLADLVLLDTRLWARTATTPGIVGVNPVEVAGATLLGEDQATWLEEQIRTSTARWKLIGQQVMVANLILSPGMIINLDQWHGYPASRRRLLDFLKTSGPSNVVVLTGDLHTSWANELVLDPGDPAQYDRTTGQGAVAVEFVTPGITSPGLPPTLLGVVDQARPFNPHLRWFDLLRQGYLVLDVIPERVQAAWFLYEDIKLPQPSPERFAAAWAVKTGSLRLEEEGAPAAAPDTAPPLAP
jgi:alkaline phosphatase D